MTEVPSYRNQYIRWQSKSTDWFLYDKDLRPERVKEYVVPARNSNIMTVNPYLATDLFLYPLKISEN